MHPSISLAGGVEMPRCGLGTFKAGGTEVRGAVSAALAAGIRHIDTAAIYKNEELIAEALWDDARIPRGDVFITSKISPYQMGRKARQAAEEILQRLRVDFVDLLLIHWPGASGLKADSPRNAELRLETWRALEALKSEGRARAIGVSNFEAGHLRQLLDGAREPPAVNQIEVHPRWPQVHLRRACAEAGVAVTAYASLGCGQLLSEPAVRRAASEAGRSPAQVLLRWGLQQGCAVIPKSVRPERVREFAPAALLQGWELSAAQMGALDALAGDACKFCWDPSNIL
ncbi:glyoxal reductase-like [Raphidocelis subcapitata]|uniref:Glyoxal reductase-like n=1 Tax=Raphidocelis subcapitata TaxID=307507 RepID=A0A2V0NSM2_9CHLO|nr:glyoxal reductase-like [Raphidocelis subcapitata]|eukprot:GBF88570.1 glyoxal reductase-like [Raphidocelis subcapitata]